MYSGNIRNAVVTAEIFLAQDFPPTAEEKLKMDKKELRLQEAEAKKDRLEQPLSGLENKVMFNSMT